MTIKRKKNPKKSIKKYRKNPKHLDDVFYTSIARALAKGFPADLAIAVNYFKVGKDCIDCDHKYYECTCEGSRQKPGRPCEECGLTYCLCDYGIDRLSSENEVRGKAYEFIESKLNKEQFEKVRREMTKIWGVR